MQWRPAGWSVGLPLLIFPCTIKSRSSLLAPAHPDGHGKRAVKWLRCGVVVHCTTTDEGLSVMIVSPVTSAEPTEMSFGMWTQVDVRNHGGAQWHNTANTIKLLLCGSDANLCEITLTNCYCYHYKEQEAQLPQRDRAMPRTHFTRDRRTDRRKDGQKTVARTRYAVCITHKKRAETEEINGKDSWPTVIYCRRSPILVPMGPPNAGVLYNGRSQQTIRIQKRYFDRVHKQSHIIRTI